MKIVVCVKQVAVLGDEVEFTDDARDVDADFLDASLNEWDSYATEEALRIREKAGSGGDEIVVVSVGVGDVEPAVRRCLAMGADRAIRIDYSGSRDPITIARLLAPEVRAESPDLVFCGVQSSDAVQAAVGTALAELLDFPRVAVVTRIEWDPGAGRATVDRELEGGLVDVTEVDTPALLTIQTGINQPRYATLRAIKHAEQKQIQVVPPREEGEPAYRLRRMFAPPKGEGAELLDGSAADIARRIAGILQERLK
ncbi:MAG: electron transfer flavoprotein subunit beta/FixA family protein [Gaiellaceae bacterium]